MLWTFMNQLAHIIVTLSTMLHWTKNGRCCVLHSPIKSKIMMICMKHARDEVDFNYDMIVGSWNKRDFQWVSGAGIINKGLFWRYLFRDHSLSTKSGIFFIWKCLEEQICFLTATCVYLFSTLTRNNQCER